MIWKPSVVAATVVERDGRFLCVEENIEGRVVINQPAGHLDPGETIVQAAERETLEETAWTVKVSSLIGIYMLETATPGLTFLRFCFAAEPLSHDPGRTLDSEIITTHWLDDTELEALTSRHRSPLVMQAIRDYAAGHRFPLSILHA